MTYIYDINQWWLELTHKYQNSTLQSFQNIIHRSIHYNNTGCNSNFKRQQKQVVWTAIETLGPPNHLGVVGGTPTGLHCCCVGVHYQLDVISCLLEDRRSSQSLRSGHWMVIISSMTIRIYVNIWVLLMMMIRQLPYLQGNDEPDLDDCIYRSNVGNNLLY